MIGWLTHLQHTRAKNVWFVAVYLNGEFTATEGQYARRKIFTLIGLYSPKGPDWTNMGLSLVRGMLNSARGISDKDMSAEAQAARRVNGFSGARGSGVAITAGFEFDVRVRFDTDALEVTLDLKRLGSITSIPLLELRR